jgi:hypothetical protein
MYVSDRAFGRSKLRLSYQGDSPTPQLDAIAKGYDSSAFMLQTLSYAFKPRTIEVIPRLTSVVGIEYTVVINVRTLFTVTRTMKLFQG